MTGAARFGDSYAELAGAYVLDALDETERVEFEAHLETCPACRAEVADLGALPAMMSGLDEAAFVVADPSPPPELLLNLLRAARRERLRRRVLIGTVAAAVAAALIITTAAVAASTHPSPSQVAMRAVTSSPISATAVVRKDGSGTRIDLRCTYTGSYAAAANYGLLVFPKNGGQVQHAGYWPVEDGLTTFSGTTTLAMSDISKIEVVSPTGAPLLELDY